MPNFMRLRAVYLLVLIVCLLAVTSSSLLAQDTPTDVPPEMTPTDAPTDVPTEIPTEIPTSEPPTEIPTEVPTEIIPSEVPTDVPTEIPPSETPVTETLEALTETVTEATTPPVLSPEPELSLLSRELFEIEPWTGWILPAGWTRTAVSDGFAVRISGAEAGLDSAVTLGGAYYNVAVLGYFTFTANTGVGQLVVRDSSAGSYLAHLDANGLVTLEKRDGAGSVVSSWNADTQAASGTARALRLSAMNGVLRVAVDDIEVLTMEDSAPLPPGSIKISAQFAAPAEEPSGTILFDNFFLWVPTSDLSLYPPTETVIATPTVAATQNPTRLGGGNNQSNIPQPEIMAAAPGSDNDNFADRLLVNIPYSHSSTTSDNTLEPPNEPTPSCGFNLSKTAWYVFTPSITQSYLITTLGSSFDTMLAVYTGTWGSFTQVNCADDSAGTPQAQLTLTLNSGTTYYIQLGGFNGSGGDFSFYVVRPSDAALPGAPTISGTAAGAPSNPVVNMGKTNLLQPVLAWNPGGTVVPYSYDVEVSTLNTFASTVATGTVADPDHFYVITPDLSEPALPAGQVYYWRVRARNFLQQFSAWSQVYHFTLDRSVPTAPGLTTPALNAAVTSLRPTFTWQALTDVNLYHFRVANNFSCSTAVVDAQVTTATYMLPTNLAQGEYWFCVEAKDTAGNWSGFVGEKRRFVVNISLTPANNATVVIPATADTTNVTFTWTAIPGATYGLTVADDSSFTSLVLNDIPVPGTSYTLTGQSFGTYYWRVSVDGFNIPGSLARSYTITPPLPAAPSVQTVGALPGAVANAGFTNDTTPILDWTVPTNWVSPSVGQSITYELQLSTNSTFTALVASPITGIGSDNHEWTATTLPTSSGTIYYWRVRAITNLGVIGTWSAAFRFTMDTNPANAPASLTAPVNNFISTSARPAFSWTAPVGGVTSYRFEISTDSGDFSIAPIPDAIVTTPRYTPTISLPQDTYYWQVWARDAAGNESLLPTGFRTLTVDYRTAPAVNFAAVTTGTSNVTFAWMLVAGAPAGTNYTIEIDADLNGTADTTLPAVPSASTMATGLAQGDYQYRLVVNNGFFPSGWRHFFVSLPLPGKPLSPFTPPNNAVTSDTTPLLTWTAPTVNPGNVTGYMVEISTNNTFTAHIAGSPFNSASPSPTYTLPTLIDNTYYWRVRAYNSLGAPGTVYSNVWFFRVDTTPANPPTSLSAPADNATSTSARPAFSWTAPPGGASSYRFEISTDSGDFTSAAIPDAIVTTTSYTATIPLPQDIYYWQVWARDTAGNESLLPAGFRTLTVDYRTAPLSNFTAFTGTTSNVTFAWMLVAGTPAGTNYTIEIDADLNGTADATLPAVASASTVATGLAQGDYQYRLVVNNGFLPSSWRPFFVSPLLPGAPVATFSPANNAFVSDLTPTLQWNTPPVNPSNVTGYVVEISTNNTFTAHIAGSPFDAGMTTTFTTPTLTETKYYWRVRSKAVFNLFSAYSAIMSFTVDVSLPPSAPGLTTPLDNATTNLPRPTFTWGTATDATRYVIEIDDENGFNNPLFYTATVTTTSHTLPTSTYLRQSVYYWRVWAMDAAGNLNSGPITFRTLNVNYSTTPAVNAVMTTGSTNVTVRWPSVPITPVTPGMITVQIDNNSNFSSPERTSPTLASNITSYTTTSALPAGQIYYWRVLVNGHPTWPTALARSFTISPAAPPAPLLTALPAATSDTTPAFSWSTVSSPAGASVTGYELQLSTTSNFATFVGGAPVAIAGSGTNSHTWTSDLPATTGQVYYSRIRAVTNLNVFSTYSTVRSFTLDTTAPAVPVLTAPANNAIVTTQTPTFTWAAIPGAASYQIRYGTTSDLTAVSPITVTTTSHTPTVALLFTNYYWEVRTLDAAGNVIDWNNGGTWEPITNRRVVKITALPGGAPLLWGYNSAQPNLTWTPVFWAQMYEIEVSTTSTFMTIVWTSNGVPATSTPNVTVGTLPNGTYYWRVRARTPTVVNGGVWGSWSAVYTFTVEAPS